MGDFAWVTLATNDTYSLGALVVAHSLRNVGTSHQLVVMVTPGVTAPMREKLASVFNVVFEVNILDSKDEANLMLLQRPELGVTFTKLHCWRLTQFKKCVFLDADTLVLQKCDELFEREELSAAPDVGWPDCFNSGVYVYTPSEATYESLVKFALEKGSFDGGDQGLLNLYFSDWAHKDISRHLPFIYNMCSTACYSYLPAFKQFGDQVKIIHFIGASKPWLQYFNTETMEVSSAPGFEHLKGIFEHWWNVFCKHVHSTLSPVMARTNTAIASCTSPSFLPLHSNKPIHQNTHCADGHSDIQTNHLPPWDPWEDYQQKTDSINNQEQTIVAFPTTHHHTYSSSQINVVHQYLSDTEPVVVVHNRDEIHHTQCTNQNIESSHYVQDSSNNSYVNSITPSETNISSVHESSNNSYVNSFTPSETNISSVHESSNNSYVNSFTPSETNISSVHESHIVNEPVTSTVSVHHIHTNVSPIITPPQCTTTDCHTPDPNVNSLTAVYKCKSASPVTTDQSSFTDSHSGSTEAQIDKHGGLAGAFAQMTLGEPRSPTQSALEEHMRRQGWEVGRIDYLGQDSFDNIWKKICQTLSEVPQKQPSPPKELAPAVVSTPVEPTAAAPAETTPAVSVEPTIAAPAVPTPAAPAEPIVAATAVPTPAAPVEATPAAPVEATPAAPVEATPAAPVEATPAAPVEATPAAPVEATPAAPVEATPAAPVEATPAAPVEATPAAPVEATPAAPAEATPAAPAEAIPVTAAVPTPAVPAEATPVAAAGPTPPAEATSAATAEVTPAAPAEPIPAATAEAIPAATAVPTPAAPVEATPIAPAEAAPVTPAEAAPVTPAGTTPAAPVKPITVTPIQITPATPTTPPAEPVPVLPTALVQTPEPAPLSESSSKVPAETVVPAATAEGAVKPDAPSKPVQTETPKDTKVKTVEKSPSTTSAEQESTKSTPTPPPRKGSKNGGAASKKTPKKK